MREYAFDFIHEKEANIETLRARKRRYDIITGTEDEEDLILSDFKRSGPSTSMDGILKSTP